MINRPTKVGVSRPGVCSMRMRMSTAEDIGNHIYLLSPCPALSLLLVLRALSFIWHFFALVGSWLVLLAEYFLVPTLRYYFVLILYR